MRRAADGTIEADLFELDGIPPKDPPRVRGQPSAYVAARELVLAFSNSFVHADLWLVPVPPALNALMEQLRRPAPPPPLHGAGSASHCPIALDNEDQPGGTAPFAGAVQALVAEHVEAAERRLGHASSSAARDPAAQTFELDGEEDAPPGGTAPLPPAPAVAGQQGPASSSSAPRRDPAVVPAARAGTRPPSRLDEAAWGAYVYKNNKTETWRACWGFTGDTRKGGLKVKKEETILAAKNLPSKEAAAMKRFEVLLAYGELDRISWDLREFYKKRKALDSIAERALLEEVRDAVAPRHGDANLVGEWEMVQKLAKRPCHELAQLVVLAAKAMPARELAQEGGRPAEEGRHVEAQGEQVATQAMTAATAASTQPAALSTQEVAQLEQQPEWVDPCAGYGEREEEEDGEEEGEEEEEEEEEEVEEGE